MYTTSETTTVIAQEIVQKKGQKFKGIKSRFLSKFFGFRFLRKEATANKFLKDNKNLQAPGVGLAYFPGVIERNNFVKENYDQDRRKIDSYLKNIPDLQRRVFEYKTFDGMTTSWICSYLNINEKTHWELIRETRIGLISHLGID